MLDFFVTRRRIALFGFILTGVGALAAHPTWARSIGADVWNVPALESDLRASAEEQQLLEGQGEQLRRRIEVKESIVADLIAGRLTLAEATDRFTLLNSVRPEYLRMIRNHFPGETDQEKMARNVISFASLRMPPGTREVTLRRLETELHQMISGSASH